MEVNRKSLQALSLITVVFALAAAELAAQVPTVSTNYVLPSSAADTTKPGFIWRIHQVATSQGNSNARTESQLAGQLGPNIADPSAQGVALAPASAPVPDTDPITFEIPTVINLDRLSGSFGNFTPDDQMPGMAGVLGGTDNTAAEILTWLDLPAGDITIGVNSDDGFRMTIGGPTPSDQLAAVKVGEYEGGRGAADTTFTFRIAQAGLYAARVSWENGTGDANIEWFWVKTDGSKVLINEAGIKAYRAVTVPTKAVVRKVTPAKDGTGVAPNTIIAAELVDGGTPIDPATVKLSLDGTVRTVTPTKSGSVTTVSYQPTQAFAAGSKHQAALSFTEGTSTLTLSWSFTVAGYAILSPSLKVSADTSKPGFLWNVFANSGVTENSIRRAERELGGVQTASDGTLLANQADPNAQNVALAPGVAPNPANALVRFEIASVINLSHTAGEANGNFGSDGQIPGLPAVDGSNDGVAAEIITYVELPTGIITMGVNSDDNFRTLAGIDAGKAVLLGEANPPGGRGATDTLFNFEVQEAGVYPLRTVYEQGTLTANIEWFTVKSDGTKVLLNDTANGGFKAYRAVTGAVAPYLRMVDPPTTPRQLNQVANMLNAVLEDGTTSVDASSVALKVNGKPLTGTVTRQGQDVVVSYTPNKLFVPDEEQTGELTFKVTGNAQTNTVTWKFRNLKSIVLPAPAITENFDSYTEFTYPSGWTQVNFTDTDTAGDNPDALDSDTYKPWVIVDRARLEVLKGRIFATVAPDQSSNGVPITVENFSSGNVLYAESDVRGGNQVQFLTTKGFDLSRVTNVVLTFSALYEQNQDNIGSVEYSVDQGTNWLPIVYYLDFVDGGGDIRLNPDGTVDAVATMTNPNSDTANWVTNGVPKGDKYGDGISAPITQALAPYIAPRYNDNSTEGKRLEVFRLPQAGLKPDVRLRFAQLGTGSWYFGVDNIAFYDGPAPEAVVAAKVIIAASGTTVTLSWTGTGTLEETTSLAGTWSASSSQANPQTIQTSGATKFYRIRQ